MRNFIFGLIVSAATTVCHAIPAFQMPSKVQDDGLFPVLMGYGYGVLSEKNFNCPNSQEYIKLINITYGAILTSPAMRAVPLHSAFSHMASKSITNTQCTILPEGSTKTFTIGQLMKMLSDENKVNLLIAKGFIYAAHDRYLGSKCAAESTIPDVDNMFTVVFNNISRLPQETHADQAPKVLEEIFSSLNQSYKCI